MYNSVHYWQRLYCQIWHLINTSLPNQCINILLCIYVYIYNDLYIYVYINMTFNNESANNLRPGGYDQKRSASHLMKE